MTELFTQDGKRVNVEPAIAEEAILKGTATYRPSQRFYVRDHGGEINEMGGDTLRDALVRGGSLATDEEVEHKQTVDSYDNAGGAVLTAGAAAANTLTMGLADAVGAAIGGEDYAKGRRAMEEAHPVVDTVARIGTEGAAILATGGLAGAAKGLLGAGAKAAAPTIMGRAMTTAAAGAAETALFETGRAISDMSIQEAKVSAEQIFSRAGEVAVTTAVGGALGGTLSLVGSGASAAARKVKKATGGGFRAQVERRSAEAVEEMSTSGEMSDWANDLSSQPRPNRVTELGEAAVSGEKGAHAANAEIRGALDDVMSQDALLRQKARPEAADAALKRTLAPDMVDASPHAVRQTVDTRVQALTDEWGLDAGALGEIKRESASVTKRMKALDAEDVRASRAEEAEFKSFTKREEAILKGDKRTASNAAAAERKAMVAEEKALGKQLKDFDKVADLEQDLARASQAGDDAAVARLRKQWDKLDPRGQMATVDRGALAARQAQLRQAMGREATEAGASAGARGEMEGLYREMADSDARRLTQTQARAAERRALAQAREAVEARAKQSDPFAVPMSEAEANAVKKIQREVGRLREGWAPLASKPRLDEADMAKAYAMTDRFKRNLQPYVRESGNLPPSIRDRMQRTYDSLVKELEDPNLWGKGRSVKAKTINGLRTKSFDKSGGLSAVAAKRQQRLASLDDAPEGASNFKFTERANPEKIGKTKWGTSDATVTENGIRDALDGVEANALAAKMAGQITQRELDRVLKATTRARTAMQKRILHTVDREAYARSYQWRGIGVQSAAHMDKLAEISGGELVAAVVNPYAGATAIAGSALPKYAARFIAEGDSGMKALDKMRRATQSRVGKAATTMVRGTGKAARRGAERALSGASDRKKFEATIKVVEEYEEDPEAGIQRAINRMGPIATATPATANGFAETVAQGMDALIERKPKTPRGHVYLAEDPKALARVSRSDRVKFNDFAAGISTPLAVLDAMQSGARVTQDMIDGMRSAVPTVFADLQAAVQQELTELSDALPLGKVARLGRMFGLSLAPALDGDRIQLTQNVIAAMAEPAQRSDNSIAPSRARPPDMAESMALRSEQIAGKVRG